MAEPDATPTPQPAATEPQSFSKEYVDDLRQESARYRTRAKEMEAATRKAFGLEPDGECGDLAALLAARDEKTTATALEKASARLISAEIKGLQGYDTALLEHLIDRAAITIGDDGTVSGVKEAAEAVAKAFPAVRKTGTSREPWVPKNPAAASGASANQAMNDLIRRN